MTRLATECGGLVSLSVMDGFDMVYVEVARGVAPIMRQAYVGMRIPLVHTSAGWACVAGMESEARDATLDRIKDAFAAEWTQIRRQFLDAFEQVRTNGFCTNFEGRFVPSTNAVAAPVRSYNDARHFALNLTAPGVLISKSEMEGIWGPKLAKLARQVQGETPAPPTRV